MKLIVFIFLYFFPTKVFSQCSENGIEYQNVCFFFFANRTNFTDAEIFCQSMNGHLASIHDGFTNVFLASQSKNLLNSTSDFWIGLDTLTSPGNWTWTDNTIFDFNNWSPSESTNVSQTCASLTISNGLWKSDDCSKSKAYACEVSLTTPTNTILTMTSTSSSSPSYPAYMNCTEGWVYFEPTHSCYGHDGNTSRSGNWSWGEQWCQSMDGHMASLHSYDETRFITTLLSFTSHNLWTGLSSNDSEISWGWSDDSPVDYLPWAAGSPNLNISSCAYLGYNVIHDGSCDYMLNVICKKPANVTELKPTQSPSPSYPAYMNCTEGWVYFEPTHSCYGHDGYLEQDGSWNYAEQWCENKGGHLPSLHSYDETRFISTGALFGGGILWIGLASNDNEVSWKWSDNSPVDYLPWRQGSPNLNVSSCVRLYANSIYDYDCINTAYFICKKPAF